MTVLERRADERSRASWRVLLPSGFRRRPGAAPQAPREFGLRQPSPDPELEGLLGLARWLDDDLAVAIVLSHMTGARIRELFPAGQTDPRIIPCLSGLDLEADMADIFAASAALGRMQEEADFKAFMSLVRPGAVVVDVGANFGVYAVHAALHAGPEGRIFAFEPCPGAFDLLQSNILRNHMQARSMAIRQAVGAKEGWAKFRVAADSAFSGLRDTGRSTTVGNVTVSVCTLDQFEPLTDRTADLIKIDTEGGEADVLAGAHALLARSPDVTIMFEYSHKNLDEPGRLALIAELELLLASGLGLFGRGPGGSGLFAVRPDELVGQRSENLFLVRPGSGAHAALAAAVGAPQRPPTPDQAVALAVLRRLAQDVNAYQDLCFNIMTSACRALGPDHPADPIGAVAAMCDRLFARSQAGAAEDVTGIDRA